MSKHRLSPAPLPPLKRLHTPSDTAHVSAPAASFDGSLYDELVLHILTFLPSWSLCQLQSTSRNLARLSSDNQLWKRLYIQEYGRSRLRGGRGYVSRHDGREVKPLPARAKGTTHHDPERDWKWMFRISSNWRTGRCTVESLLRSDPAQAAPDHIAPVLLSGGLAIIASTESRLAPEIILRQPSGTSSTIACPPQPATCRITAFALDQSPPDPPSSSRIAVFLSNGSFHVISFPHCSPSAATVSHTHAARTRHPVSAAAYHHPLLVSLSAADSFRLALYDLSSAPPRHTQTLSSFTSFPPSSLVLSARTAYKLVLAYAVPVYPAHWSVGATELRIAAPALTVTSTRTIRAFDVPAGWLDAAKLRGMREQWGRKVERIADVQTDGKWVVLGPGAPPDPSYAAEYPPPDAARFSFSSSNALQLYRLSLPASSASRPRKLTFVRTLRGQDGPVSALALADGRCVSLGANGSIWVWDLERGGDADGVQVAAHAVSETDARLGLASVAFDERRIISRGPGGQGEIQVRRFDV